LDTRLLKFMLGRDLEKSYMVVKDPWFPHLQTFIQIEDRLELHVIDVSYICLSRCRPINLIDSLRLCKHNLFFSKANKITPSLFIL
jgi:hypothetical protein